MNIDLPLPKQPLLIEHRMDDGEIIPQRPIDGYINATAMCRKAGKLFNDYSRLKSTVQFFNSLSTATGIPVAELIQTFMGGIRPETQGTWVHPKVAIHLAQWLSPEFAVQVTEWVFDWMRGISTGYMPLHVKRYMENRAKIPPTHFSMLNEIYLHFIAPLEDSGFILPDKLVPDASTGRMFSGYLRKEGIEVDNFPNYEHVFLDNKRPVVLARLYPIEHLPKFRNYFHDTWLPKQAKVYFSKRCKEALPYLEKVLKGLPPPPPKIKGPSK